MPPTSIGPDEVVIICEAEQTAIVEVDGRNPIRDGYFEFARILDASGNRIASPNLTTSRWALIPAGPHDLTIAIPGGPNGVEWLRHIPFRLPGGNIYHLKQSFHRSGYTLWLEDVATGKRVGRLIAVLPRTYPFQRGVENHAFEAANTPRPGRRFAAGASSSLSGKPGLFCWPGAPALHWKIRCLNRSQLTPP